MSMRRVIQTLALTVVAIAPVSLALAYLRIVCLSYIGLGVGIVLGNAMAGAGATRTTLIIDAAVILGFQVPLCIGAVALFDAPLETLFGCVAATNLVSSIAYAGVYGRGRWQRSAARSLAQG